MNVRLYQSYEWLRKNLDMSKIQNNKKYILFEHGNYEIIVDNGFVYKKKKKVKVIKGIWNIMNNGIK